eukprot:3166540-Pyramimonas_sp.AAC.1
MREKPVSPKSEEDDDQHGAGEAEHMVGAVGPAEAAPAGYASDYSDTLSTGADIAREAGAPIDPRCVVTEEIDIYPKRWAVYRAGSAGR